MMTKSKWYFVIPVLALLLLDQSMKKDIVFREDKGENVSRYRMNQEHLTRLINVVIIVTIFIGTIHYAYLQRLEYGKKFSWYLFFLSWTKCKPKSS